MADIKISQLTAKGAAIAATDLLEIAESNGAGGYVAKSVTGANILSSKQDTLVSGTNIKTIEGQSILGVGNIEITNADVGLGNVDNTSDLNKPISTATQAALNAKQNTITNSDSITQGTTNLFLTTAERTKLTNTSGTNTGDQTNITGNAATVTTNANLTGVVTSTGNTTAIANGAISNAMLANGAVANLSGTNTGDNATNSQYSGLVSNATHTGDATGNVGLTVKGINGTLLSTLGTGILKNTTGTGVPSIAVAADFPTLNQNTTGTADNVTGIVAVANGGTGTATPSLGAGTNVTITGTFPNQTINSSCGGGGGGGLHVLTQPISTWLYAAQAYNVNSGTASLSNGVNNMMLSLFYPATTFTISELSINVTTAASSASNVKILVYSDDGFGYPRAKLIESSALSMTTTGAKVFLTSYTFTAGTKYWMGVIIDASAGALVTALGSNILYTRSGSYTIVQNGMYIGASFASPPSLNTIAATSGNMQSATVYFKI